MRRIVMEIRIGSTNPTKTGAVREVFHEYSLTSLAVPSHVSSQPFSDEETRLGAIHRAHEALNGADQPAIGIGLEGGVMFINQHLYLCNWGALVTSEEKLYTASGARIPLPSFIRDDLLQGLELGESIEKYVKRKGIRRNEGTIGIFTNQFISRTELFLHIVKLLKGQFEYWK